MRCTLLCTLDDRIVDRVGASSVREPCLRCVWHWLTLLHCMIEYCARYVLAPVFVSALNASMCAGPYVHADIQLCPVTNDMAMLRVHVFADRAA